MTKRFPRLWLPDEATGRPAVTGAQHRQQAGGVDNPITMNGRNPVPATNLRGRGASSGADHAANAAVVGPSIPLVPPKKSRVIQSILYLDSLDVDEPMSSIEECPIRAAAWDDKLIQVVKRKDMKSTGEIGKMRLFLWFFYIAHIDFIQIKIDLTSFCFVFVELKKRKLVVMIGELCTDISNRLGSFVQQVGDLEQAEGSAKGACGRVKKRQRAEPTVFVDEDDDDDEDDEDYNAEAGEDEDCDDEDDEDDADEDGDDEDNEDGDDEDGVSKEGPSNSHNNEDDDFEDRATHLEKTPMQSARGFATSGGEDIDMPNIQAPQFFDITEKIYPNSIFMEEIVRSQRVSPAITPPLDQFHRDTAVQNLQAECIALDKLAIRGDKPMQTKQKNGCTS
ncbi:hypothetical protein ACQ4PT_021822 [Festuca glaucescens]